MTLLDKDADDMNGVDESRLWDLEHITSPLRTWQDLDTCLTWIYCPFCYAMKLVGSRRKDGKAALDHEEGCCNEGS